MFNDTPETFRICLDDDWYMSGVAEQFPLLVKRLARLPDSPTSGALQNHPSHHTFEIDLAGTGAPDACGCQQLALFIRNLRQDGIASLVTNIPDAYRSRIYSLGFDRELNLSI